MRSFMRHICSVFPPSPVDTLAMVHGSSGFHWKSATCERCPACWNMISGGPDFFCSAV
jgi:hypothetical protein